MTDENDTSSPTHPVRVVFMGTPAFAVPSLRALVNASRTRAVWPAGLVLAGVITRPDKPAGRGRQLVFSPVKQCALDAGVPVSQPGPLRRPEAMAALRDLAPDLIIVAAFGQILPLEALEMPPLGCLNVHASLLPRWRGASPIAAALRAGDVATGVTIMRMEEGLDTGAIVSARSLAIAETDTTGALTGRLATLGADLLLETLPGWLSGSITPIPQDEAHATMTRPLLKSDGRLDWRLPAEELARVVRSVTPWPGAFTTWQGKTLKVVDVAVIPGEPGRAAGTCFTATSGNDRGVLACACGQGALALKVIQLEGKRSMPSVEALRGYPALAQATFGE